MDMKSFKKFVADANRRKPEEQPEPFEMPKKGKKLEPLASDLEPIQDEIDRLNKPIKLDDNEWFIDHVLDVSIQEPTIIEAIVINADFGNKEVKRGDILYITAMLRKKDNTYINSNMMGVIKVRVVDIYNTLNVLNNLK